MAERRAYKTDASFLEYLVIGATGTRAVLANLEQTGHKPIELERGSLSYKIWKKIKIKRVRVPDLLCLTCGTRFEARAKRELEISMSHSVRTAERSWDRGLHDHDQVALCVCQKTGAAATNWTALLPIQYVRVGEMRRAFAAGSVAIPPPKGNEQGSETRVIWPSAVSSDAGVVKKITPTRIQLRRASDGRTISYGLQRGKHPLSPLLTEGAPVGAHRIIAAVVPVTTLVTCAPTPVAASHYLDLLSSPLTSDKYTAAKALAYFDEVPAQKVLAVVASDVREHVYVRLEAAASLVRLGDVERIGLIEEAAHTAPVEERLESVIILGELASDRAEQTLVSVLDDPAQDPEIRGGAAWALGEIKRVSSVDALVRSFGQIEEPIRAEAVKALRKIATESGADILAPFSDANEDCRAGIAWAAARSGHMDPLKLRAVMVDDDARRWVAYILGIQSPDSVVSAVEAMRLGDPEVYFATTVLWKIFASWINDVEEY